jgi:hypothetical protein
MNLYLYIPKQDGSEPNFGLCTVNNPYLIGWDKIVFTGVKSFKEVKRVLRPQGYRVYKYDNWYNRKTYKYLLTY